VKYISSYYK